MMDFEPVRKNYRWNYSDRSKADYTPTITGTVYALQHVQTIDYHTKKAKFWPEGNPMWSIRMTLVIADGSIKTFTFQPASVNQRKNYPAKPNIHMDLWKLTGNTVMTNLIGKTITITTTDDRDNLGFGRPRRYEVSLSEEGPYQPNEEIPEFLTVPELLSNTGASGGKMNQEQQPVAQVQPQAVPQQHMVQPAQVPSASFVPQMTQQVQPVQPAMQPAQSVQQVQPMQPAMPSGMDPNVAAAMQNIGASNVQPMSSVYDSDIPF